MKPDRFSGLCVMLICVSLCFVERLNFVDQIQFLFAIHDADGTLKLCLKFLKSAFTDNIDFFIVIVMSLASSCRENPLTLLFLLNVFLQCISVDKNKLISLCIISSLKKTYSSLKQTTPCSLLHIVFFILRRLSYDLGFFSSRIWVCLDSLQSKKTC